MHKIYIQKYYNERNLVVRFLVGKTLVKENSLKKTTLITVCSFSHDTWCKRISVQNACLVRWKTK